MDRRTTATERSQERLRSLRTQSLSPEGMQHHGRGRGRMPRPFLSNPSPNFFTLAKTRGSPGFLESSTPNIPTRWEERCQATAPVGGVARVPTHRTLARFAP